MPWIADRTIETHKSRGRHAERVHVRFADHNRAGVLQPTDNVCVLPRNALRKALECRCGPETCRVVEVFYGHGNTVQRPAPAACLDFGFGKGSGSPGSLGVDGDERVEARTERVSACEARVSHRHRRSELVADPSADII